MGRRHADGGFIAWLRWSWLLGWLRRGWLLRWAELVVGVVGPWIWDWWIGEQAVGRCNAVSRFGRFGAPQQRIALPRKLREA